MHVAAKESEIKSSWLSISSFSWMIRSKKTRIEQKFERLARYMMIITSAQSWMTCAAGRIVSYLFEDQTSMGSLLCPGFTPYRWSRVLSRWVDLCESFIQIVWRGPDTLEYASFLIISIQNAPRTNRSTGHPATAKLLSPLSPHMECQ